MKREIGGAGLGEEPNVPAELFNMHKAVFTKEAVDDLGELIAANLDAFIFADKPLLTPDPLQ